MMLMESLYKNPFYEEYSTPFSTPPFDQIKLEHYEPAFKKGIHSLNEEVRLIAENSEEPTFNNTIVALERSGALLEKVASVFFNVLSADANDEMMEISQRVSPQLSECTNNIYLNESLFNRVRYIYDQRLTLSLSKEDLRLLENTFDAFSSRGAMLDKENKAKYRQLSTELSLLTLTFEQNVLKDKNRFEMLLLSEEELEGLPNSIREAAEMRAHEKGKEGWLFNLSAPSYVPFMRYSAKRSLREKMYRAYMSIANKDDEFDNKEVVKKIVNCRLELSHLMGYKNYAEYKLKHSMAGTSERVYRLLYDLLNAYKSTAINEYYTIKGFATGSTGERVEIKPWDWNYYSEKLKNIQFKVNDEMTRPYFELSNVQKNIFGLATRLYGITFCENQHIPVYHPEVKAYEVYDDDKSFLGILYTDFFPRDGKQSGAWMNSIKEQYFDPVEGDSRPQIIIVMNFTRPTATKPSLLTFDEVNTFLHEFGHALHGLFARGKYASLSGTNVYRDFVELPSQIMENWLTEKEYLDKIAIHYKTGENIPENLVDNLVNASNFNVGYACCRQLSFGFLDMEWHTITKPFEGDIEAFEKDAWKSTVVVPEVSNALMSTNFGHIFSGGYAAGYYGYKWAEVLDADAFSVFKQNGLFNRKIAYSFRKNILSKGGIENPEMLYENFRGQAPTIDALLRRNGIVKNEDK